MNIENEALFTTDVGQEKNDKDDWKDADFLNFSTAVDSDVDISNDENLVDENDTNGPEMTQPGVISHTFPHTNKVAPWMALSCLHHEPSLNHSRHARFKSFHSDKKNMKKSFPRSNIPLIALHNEIIGFCKLMKPQKAEIEAREKLIEEIRQVAMNVFGGPKHCDFVVFGSQATKLFLPSSDIDIVINLSETYQNLYKQTKKVNNDDDDKDQRKDKKNENNEATKVKESVQAKEKREMEEWDKYGGVDTNRSPLILFAEALRKNFKHNLSYLEVVDQTRIPIVKFTYGKKSNSISVDVCFNEEGGPLAAQIMNKFLDTMPPLRPLVFVLKYFLKIRGLHEPYFGGMGSFMLQMLIVSFLQHRAREEYNKHHRSIVMNLGSLLLDFFEFYTMDFNFVTTGISVRNDGSYFPKGSSEKRDMFFQPTRMSSIAIENPMDITSDVGKSTFKWSHIQRSFDVAFRLLLAHVSMPITNAVSILAAIIPQTDELWKRCTLLNTCFNTVDLSSDISSINDSDDDHGNNNCYGNGRRNGKFYNKKRQESNFRTHKKNGYRNQHYYDDESDDDNFFPMKEKKKHNSKAKKKPRHRY